MSNLSEYHHYGSIDDADQYFGNQLFAYDWTGASNGDKEKALIMASQAIDSLRFRDYKWPVHVIFRDTTSPTDKQVQDAYDSEPHQWPRGNGDPDDPTTLLDTVFVIWQDASSGTYTLEFNGVETGALAFDAVAADVQTALEALSNITAGDVTVEDDTEYGGKFVVTFDADSLDDFHSQLDIDGAGLNGQTIARVVTVEDNIPMRIKWAVFEEAISLLSGRNAHQEWENAVMTSNGVSSSRVSSDRGQLPPVHTRHFITSSIAWKYLLPFLDSKETNSFKFGRK